MPNDTSTKRLALDWALPLVGCAGVVVWGMLFPKTPPDPQLSPFVRVLYSAFSSTVGTIYVCLLGAWWTYRLIRHGERHKFVSAIAVIIEIAGLYLLGSTEPRIILIGLLLMIVGVGLLLAFPMAPATRHGQGGGR